MSAQPLRCSQCGHLLALVDAACPACGTAVPDEARAALMGARAEGLAENGQYAEAARALDMMLAMDLKPEEAKVWWRKRGAWLQRSGRPGDMDQAEAALAKSLSLDDADGLSHQLWIDLLNRLGRLDKARQWYKERLDKDPADAVAAKQMTVLRMTADFLAAPPPKLNIPKGKDSTLAKMVKPTPWKMVTAGVNLLAALGAMGMSFGQAEVIKAPEGMEGMQSMLQMATDPWLNGLLALLCGAYLYWGWMENRRG